MERPVRSIIEDQKPITASADITVAAAARLMKEHRIGAILVLDEGRLAGIFTERDALFRVIAEGRDPAQTHLREVMTANPRTKNGKVVELAVKAAVHRMPVSNIDSLANPEALELFKDLEELAT